MSYLINSCLITRLAYKLTKLIRIYLLIRKKKKKVRLDGIPKTGFGGP